MLHITGFQISKSLKLFVHMSSEKSKREKRPKDMIDPTRWGFVLLIGQLAPQRVGVLSGRVGGREREGLEKLLRLAPVHCCSALYTVHCTVLLLCTVGEH